MLEPRARDIVAMGDPGDRLNVLAIDDDPSNLKLLRHQLESADYNVLTAANGEDALELLYLNKDSIHAILLDRVMPRMDGMEFIRKVKSDELVSNIPVIMQSGLIDQSMVEEGIAAGAYYYLTKPYKRDSLLSITHAAISSFIESSELRQDILEFKSRLHLTKESLFEAQTLDDVRNLSAFIANFYPEPERVVNGISELLLNAVEHGNLEITYWMKSQLIADDMWLTEINKRLSMPEYEDRRVQIHYQRHPSKITLTIRDQGSGFNWEKYMEIEPGRATHSHGRGIALANMMSFDNIEYLSSGSEVICTVNL